MPQNRWKYPDGSVTIKLYEPFPAGESLLLKLEDKTMDYNKAALEMHETHKGKVGIVSKVEVSTRDDLSTAYTPGVAEPCRKIKENPDDVYKYTFKGNMVAVVSNGTAVLGLGDIGPEAGLPVMEGKAVLFKEFGGVDAFPICIDAHDAASVIAACKAIAPTFVGINLEDIKSPECFEIEETLERELDIPVFHDDQHGTAIVVTAALINALRVVGKKMEDVHIVLNGPGAAGTAIIKMLMTAGAKDIIAVDQFGTMCTSSIFLPTTRRALMRAAVTTMAVPCWSSWNTGMSSSFSSVCSISKHSGLLISSRLMPPKVGAMALQAAITSSALWALMQMGKASTPPNSLNSTALPSMTGRPASGPMSPRPSTAVPLETTATMLPLKVYLYTSSGFALILRQGSATPGV